MSVHHRDMYHGKSYRRTPGLRRKLRRSALAEKMAAYLDQMDVSPTFRAALQEVREARMGGRDVRR